MNFGADSRLTGFGDLKFRKFPRLPEKNQKAILLSHDLPNYSPISGSYAGEVDAGAQLREIERNAARSSETGTD